MNRSLTLTVIVTMEIITPNLEFFNHVLKKKTIYKVGCSHFASTQTPNKTYRQIQCTSVSELSNRFYFVFSRFHCNITPFFGH